MSKIGKINITIPEKVKVMLSGTDISIEGPLGKKKINIDLEMFDLNIDQQNHYFHLCIEHNHHDNSKQKKVTQIINTRLRKNYFQKIKKNLLF